MINPDQFQQVQPEYAPVPEERPGRINREAVVGMVALAIAGGATEVGLAAEAAPAAAAPATLSAQPFEINTAQDGPWAIEQHPYTGPDSAQASGTKQECIRKLSKPPQGAHGKMTHPGTLHQETLVRAQYGAVEGCDAWQRVAKYREQIKRGGRWINPVNPIWYSAEFPTSHSNERHSLTITDYATTDSIDNCVRGHREPDRVQLRSFVRNADTGKIAARGKIKVVPIRIQGGC